MANLTIKNVPEDLLRLLREAAARERRSLNSEVIRRLEESVGGAPVDPRRLLAEVRAVRERNRVPYLTDGELREMIDEGRE